MKARKGRLPVVAVAATLAVVSAAAVMFFVSRGWVLYYGDAAAHLNIARRMTDSRTPGWEQVGTVWLPLPHVLMLPLAAHDWLWRTGLAGAIPSALAFVLAGTLLFLAARRVFSNTAAGVAACLLLALNPNLLYLQATPMTEPIFLAMLAGVLYFTVRFRARPSLGSAIGAGLFSLAGTLTRYEGWFLVPFVTLYFLLAAGQRRLTLAVIYGGVASLGPLYWLAHNWYYFGNALEFYNGSYSAKAIQGVAPYPGLHDWGKAWLQFRSAAWLCVGTPLVWLSAGGAVIAALRRVIWPLVLLALTPAFYLISIHSAGTPIFVPHLWPFSYYNTRYGLQALPLLAFAAAALVLLAPARFRAAATGVVVLAGVAPWLGYPRAENWICWKESQVNSDLRRAWSREAAEYLKAHYGPGDGILASFGDQTDVFRQAGIPLVRNLNDCDGVQWLAATARPDVFLLERWAVAISGDAAATAILHARRSGPHYECVKLIALKGAPVIEIYRRTP